MFFAARLPDLEAISSRYSSEPLFCLSRQAGLSDHVDPDLCSPRTPEPIVPFVQSMPSTSLLALTTAGIIVVSALPVSARICPAFVGAALSFFGWLVALMKAGIWFLSP